MFMKDGLDGKKNAKQSQGCHENALIQNFKKSPHLMGLANYPYIPFMASLWIRSGEWLAIKGNGSVSQNISSGGSFRSSH